MKMMTLGLMLATLSASGFAAEQATKPKAATVDTSRLEQACATQAATVWELAPDAVRADAGTPTDNGLYNVALNGGSRRAVCTGTLSGEVRFINNK